MIGAATVRRCIGAAIGIYRGVGIGAYTGAGIGVSDSQMAPRCLHRFKQQTDGA